MNAPFVPLRSRIRLIDLADRNECARIERFVAEHARATPFHRLAWLQGVAAGTGSEALVLAEELGGYLRAMLSLSLIHSPVFGRVLAASGFAVAGGILSDQDHDCSELFAAAEELALRRSCTSIELRGGVMPRRRDGWTLRNDSHSGFIAPLAADNAAQLLAIPRKQRAEVRKGLANDLTISIGTAAADRAAHYAVYAQSVRNLGTPVFPRRLFEEVLDRFGSDADILTVRAQGQPVASVLSLYHRETVLPYWGGGTQAARHLRANDRMYYELMLHARARGCTRFDFGRSKCHSGAHDFKRNWGFEPQPLLYATWTAPGAAKRDASPVSAKNAAQVAVWRKLPLGLANALGPLIARGLG